MVKKRNLRQPTELELLILKVLWRADDSELPLAVRDIRNALADGGRDLAHTSVITVLNIMFEKKFLKRSKRKNAFYFSALVKEDAVQSRVVNDVLNRVFDGSAQTLMLALLDSSDVDVDDLAEIKRLINRKHKEKQN